MKRRDFIKNMTLTLGSISPLLKIGGGLSLVTANLLASSAPTSGYKAIVIIHLDGGNDAMNSFPPTEANAHAEYANIRSSLAVKDVDLSESIFYTTDDTTGHYKVPAGGVSGDKQPYWPDDGVSLGGEDNKNEQYIVGSYHTKDENGDKTGLGIHGYMPELAALYDNKKLSIVSNVGTLVKPTTRAAIDDGTATLPPFLFSHLHQYRAVSQLNSNPNDKTGWAGRLADRWQVGGPLGLNISYAGGTALFNGTQTSGLKLGGGGISEYIDNTRTISLLKDTATISESNHFKRVYNNRMRDSAELIENINSVLDQAPDFSTFDAKNTYGDNLFDSGGDNLPFREKLGLRTHHGLSTRMFGYLSNTAKMLKLTKHDFTGSSRHIFHVSESGYDFHGGLVEAQTKKMRALSMSVGDLYKAIEEMGMQEEVMIILTSEFGRTIRSNPDGTDHGWGGHSFILCGDPKFNGGNVFGEVMTDLTLNSVNAYTNRARVIPTTSIEQMLAPALDWFGVNESDMAHVLPNLANFKTDTTIKSAFMQGVFKTT